MMSLIVFSLVFMMTFYCLYMITYQNHLASALEQRIADRLTAENELYKILYSSGEGGLIFNLKDAIYKALSNQGKKWTVTPEELGSESGIIGDISYNQGQLKVDLHYPVNLGDDMPSIEIVGELYNPIFLEGDPIVTPDSLDSEELQLLDLVYENLPGIVEEENLLIPNVVVLEQGNIDAFIKRTGYGVYKTEILVDGFSKYYSFSQPQITIFQMSKKNSDDIVELRLDLNNYASGIKAIFYVEGDVIIESDFKLNGILIIEGGSLTIKEGATFYLNGKLISDGPINNDNIVDVIANPNVAQVGIHLPGFYKPVIQYIKVY